MAISIFLSIITTLINVSLIHWIQTTSARSLIRSRSFVHNTLFRTFVVKKLQYCCTQKYCFRKYDTFWKHDRASTSPVRPYSHLLLNNPRRIIKLVNKKQGTAGPFLKHTQQSIWGRAQTAFSNTYPALSWLEYWPSHQCVHVRKACLQE